MDVFQSNPDGVVKTLVGLIKKHSNVIQIPIESAYTAKIAIDEIRFLYGNDMDKYLFLQQAPLFLDDLYWEKIAEQVGTSITANSEITQKPSSQKISSPPLDHYETKLSSKTPEKSDKNILFFLAAIVIFALMIFLGQTK